MLAAQAVRMVDAVLGGQIVFVEYRSLALGAAALRPARRTGDHRGLFAQHESINFLAILLTILFGCTPNCPKLLDAAGTPQNPHRKAGWVFKKTFETYDSLKLSMATVDRSHTLD